MTHAPDPKEISDALDFALTAALGAEIDPVETPFFTVQEVLAAYGVPDEIARSLLLSACHAYESVMHVQRRQWRGDVDEI